MEDGQMIECIDNYTDGFCPVIKTDKWQLACITYSESYGELKEFKRHMTTDEAMVLVNGSAVLYTYENGEIIKIELKKNVVYNIKTATWHHLKVSKDALVIVAEDSNITAKDSERMKADA